MDVLATIRKSLFFAYLCVPEKLRETFESRQARISK